MTSPDSNALSTVFAIFSFIFVYITTTISSSYGSSLNVALNKPTDQSSTMWSGSASYAVDGIKESNFTIHRCSHTNGQSPSWWIVDLLKVYTITSIEITNRYKRWQRLSTFSVEVSVDHPGQANATISSSTSSPFLCSRMEKAIPSGATYRLPCRRVLEGQYVRVVKDSGRLSLCEFEAYKLGVWRLEKQQSYASGLPDILETVPGRQSIMECARLCVFRVGWRCQHVQYDRASGGCRLLKSFVPTENDLNPTWDLYTLDY